MTDFSLRRIQIIYAQSLLTAVVSFVCSLVAFFLDIANLFYYHFFTIFVYLFAAYLCRRGKLRLPRLIYFLILNISIVTTASYVGKQGGVEFMMLYAISLPFFSFSFLREKHYIFSLSLFSILIWTLLYTTDFNIVSSNQVSEDIARTYIYPLSIITTLSLAAFQLIYYSKENARFFSVVHQDNDDAIEASNAKTRFLSTISHEIRTPLNAVIGLSHILADNEPREDQIENINALNYSGKLLLNLLNNVLDFSKIQSTKIELENTPTNLPEAVKQIKKIHETSCLKKGIKMNLNIDETLPLVKLDIIRFNQVINNLVTNAIKFTDKGSVSLSISKQHEKEDEITILTEVIDTGIGIPKDKHDTIFEAFTQASSTTNRLYGGTGLGLPIVKSIVEAMGGKIKIDSEPEKGSKFYFTIKLEIATDKELNKSKIKKQHDFKGKKVLIVEDNLINVMVAQQILEKEGLLVEVVPDGLQAVNIVKEQKFDVILMDIQMPVMDGYEATLKIREFNKQIPILALSASVFADVKTKIERVGMDGFIFKPFDPLDLLDKIDQTINTKRVHV